MISIRRPCVAALAAIAALAVGTPVASAITFPTALPSLGAVPLGAGWNGAGTGALPIAAGGNGALAAGACDTNRVTEGQGGTAGTQNQVCQGSGLSFIGPSIGQIANVMGPTIVGPAVIGTLIVSAGNAAGG
jgi:hypothetical protein